MKWHYTTVSTKSVHIPNQKNPAEWPNGMKRKASTAVGPKPELEEDYEEINSKSMEELE